MIFRSQANKTHFHEKCCALSLTLKVRVFGTRKWPIALARKLGSMLLTCNNISPDWDKQHINQGFCFLFLPSPNNNSLWKQPTFHEAATSFPAKWRLRKERAQKCHTRLRALVHHQPAVQAFSSGARKVLIAKAPCGNSRREEEMGRVKGRGRGRGDRREFSLLPLPLSFFRPHTYPKGYYFYSPQSSSVIKSRMAASS